MILSISRLTSTASMRVAPAALPLEGRCEPRCIEQGDMKANFVSEGEVSDSSAVRGGD